MSVPRCSGVVNRNRVLAGTETRRGYEVPYVGNEPYLLLRGVLIGAGQIAPRRLGGGSREPFALLQQ